MPASHLPFSIQEYANRLDKTRRAMEAKGIDILFVEDPSNMAWLTGYDGWSFYVHQGVLVFKDDDPIWWGRSMDGNGAVRTCYMDDERVLRYPDHYVQANTLHPMQHLAEVIRAHGYANKRIGVELENYYFSAKAYLVLHEELPDAKFVDATGLVNWQRAVKSDEELVFMRRAARISEKMIDGIVERIEPGMKKNDLVAEIYGDAIRGVDDDWGEYPAIVPLLPTGSDAAAPHLTWDGRRFEQGHATFFEIAGCYRRYHTPFCRTVFLGTPPQYMLDAEKALAAGIEAGLDMARAGNRAGQVAEALYGELEKGGIRRDGRCGYSIGISYPPDWGERTISFRREDETILEPGMTFHFMPGLWMADWGLEITESILIKEEGSAEALCKRPRELIVKD
ncbi:M24 family metallopeptidase [Chelativorans salis]|uniref:M24 family metallopeptidase n=1 Tax=Chelativorans salis TaxID=2978478 RepID=A0ABT2LMF1_9HYPH|nr:M24 family metallopeptidase [Chelativorans sp. EGI FJ00035]MCT7375755.1 M24 family metallopeptidase [Chelativorans sp. EGI FJ00035]